MPPVSRSCQSSDQELDVPGQNFVAPAHSTLLREAGPAPGMRYVHVTEKKEMPRFPPPRVQACTSPNRSCARASPGSSRDLCCEATQAHGLALELRGVFRCALILGDSVNFHLKARRSSHRSDSQWN